MNTNVPTSFSHLKTVMVRYLLETNSFEDRIGKDLAKIRQIVPDANRSRRYCQFPRKWIKCTHIHRLFCMEDFNPPKRLSTELHLSEFFYLCNC